jgi:hypothetical protein
MRDSFVFYESFYLAISELSATQQGKIFQAICRYALYEEEPELKGASAAVFRLVKPQIDANNRRYENGKKGAEHGAKGGRPKNPKETPNKPLKNPKQTPNVNVPVHVPVTVTDTVNGTVPVHVPTTDNASRGGGEDKYSIWKKLTPSDIDAIFEVYPDSGNDLIDMVNADVIKKKKVVSHPLQYILGYADHIKWDDKADHFSPPWEAI